MNRLTLSILATGLALSGDALGQTAEQVNYRVSFPNAAHHEAQIEVAFRAVPDGPLTVQMSRASPGRYAIHELSLIHI